MANIHIERTHSMGLAQARQTAQRWAAQAEEKYQLQCSYVESDARDTFSFARAGVSGTLQITPDAFTLDAKLGFLMSAFAPQIEAEMVKKIDGLITTTSANPAGTA